MTRQEFSKATRRNAFLRANGRCEAPKCGVKLGYGEAEYHHDKEAFIGGEPTLQNCVVLCRACHLIRTRTRRPEIDKTRRLADKRMGIRKRSSFPGGKNSKWRKPMNGPAVLRERPP